MKLVKKLKQFWPISFFILIILIFFAKFFFRGLLPIPADITVGMYYPWLDYKWGFTTGVPVKNPLISDVPSIIYPWRMAVIDSFKNGSWPLWNNAYFLGMPLLANFQSATLSLSNLFFLFLKPTLAWSWGIIAQTFFTLLSMFFYLKNKKLKNTSAILGSLVFAFSGFAVVWSQYNVHGWTFGFLPLMLFFIDKYFQTKEKFWLPLLSLAISFQIFSGYAPLVIYSWLIIGLSLVFQKRLFKRQSIKLVVFIFFGFGLAAVQLLPGAELISRSIRKVDPTALANDVGFLPFRNLVTLVIPSFFGNPATGNFWGIGSYDNFANWVGIIPLVLSLVMLTNPKKNKKETLLWLTVITLGLALSIKNPIGQFLAKILFLKGGIAARAMFLVGFSIAILSSFGLDLVLNNFERLKKQVLSLGLAVGLVLLTFSGWIFSQPASQLYRQNILRNSLVTAASLAVLVLFIFASLFIKRLKFFFTPLVLFLVIFGLWYPANKYWSFTKEDLVFPTTPVIDFLKEDSEIFRLEPDQVIPQNMWMPYQLEAVSGYDTLMPKRQGELLSLIKTGEVASKISRVHLMDNYDSHLFPLLNVKYILAKKITKEGMFAPVGQVREMFEKLRFELVFDDKTVSVYQDKNYLPRVWAVDQVVLTEEKDQIVALLQGEDLDLKQTAIMETGATETFAAVELSPAEITIKGYQAGRESFDVVTDGPSFLVESASFYPGWQAKLNGEKIEVFQTNYGLRGYFIPEPGKHFLEIFYSPRSFKTGLTISVVSFLVCLSTFLFYLKKNHEV